MSHSKTTKRGFSLYIEKWDSTAKKYINTCSICGYKGYSPVIEQEDFSDTTIYKELSKTLPKLELDKLGRCNCCAGIHDKY